MKDTPGPALEDPVIEIAVPEVFAELMISCLVPVSVSLAGATSSGASASPWRSAVDAWVGFFHAIDRTETWLRALLASHAVLLSTVLIYRRSERIQGALFCAFGNISLLLKETGDR